MSVLAGMQDTHQLLERDIAAVDLRLEDRTTVQLTPEAVKRREVALKAREKMLKAQEKRI